MIAVKEKLDIALVQTVLSWENPEENRRVLASKIMAISKTVDLVILPEMFATGFTMNATAVAETMDGVTVAWMQEMARKKNSAITGSLSIREGSDFYNRLLFVTPDGVVSHYDKKHLFSLAKEEATFTAGAVALIITYKGWRIKPLICYDLRFPVWARNTEYYDVLLVVANWPKSRVVAWDTLLKARAIENLCYTIGVNRTGVDGNGYEYLGHSIAIDALGTPISEISETRETVVLARLAYSKLHQTRNQLQFLKDRDDFILK